jgi:hypothetical protein
MASGTSFGLNSDAYQHFRIDYPKTLFTHIERLGANTHRHLAVDFGSGTGLGLAPLLQRFDQVIAVEPDASRTPETHLGCQRDRR